MSDLTKGVEFLNNEQVTATKLNNLVDDATINTGSVTTDKIQDGAITRDKLAEDAMGVKSIQKGTISANFTNTTVSINTVDPNKSFVILDGGCDIKVGGEGGNVQYNPYLESLTANSINIKQTRSGNGEVSWQVVEFY